MDFRDGDSAAEARSTSVPREEARAHPLDAPREMCAGAEKIVAEKAFADPLGALSSQARDGDDDARARDGEASDAESAESDEDAPTETTARRRQDDDEDREACAEWEAEKRRFAARARRAADSGAIHSRRAAAGAVQTRLEALCDPGALAVAETGRSRRKDVVATVDALREEIKTAWREKNRLDALLLTVRAASLLDVEYPALFGLVCDVLDDAGAAIYERIKAKCEFDDETGARRATLRRDFDARDVPEDAKATCLNWFRKIEDIPDVVPRVYMRIATLRCSRFVEDREALRARFAAIADVELKRVEDPLVGAFARAYAAKAGATLTALRSREERRRGIDPTPSFLEETLRSLVTDFADVADLFEYPEYAAWKRRDRAAREAERARENEDLIDAIENFFVDAFNDEWYAFEDTAEDGSGVLESVGSRTAGPGGADEADPASGALAAMRDEKRKESVAEAMAWSARCFARRAPRSALAESAADFLATASARADGTNTAETRPMKRALNVAFARACLEAMSAEDAAAAAGTFVNLLTRAASPGANDGRRDDGDRSVDPTVLECVRLLGARLSETPPPRGRDARRPARRGVVHRRDGGWRKPSPNALVVPAVRGDVDGLRRRARAGRGRRGRARGELSAGPAASRRRREGHLVSGTDLSVRRRRRAAAAGGRRPSRGGARADSRVAERERPRRQGLGSFRVGRVRRARRDAARCRPRLVFSQRASCVFVRRRARRTVSRDARFGRRASYVPRGAVSGKPSRARVRAARGGGGARIARLPR